MDIKEWITAQWDRVAAVVAVTVGGVALLLGYLGVRDALYPGQQIPYIISGGLFGLFLVGVGAALWLSADLRDEWRQMEEIDRKLGQLLEATLADTAASEAAPAIDADGMPAVARPYDPTMPLAIRNGTAVVPPVPGRASVEDHDVALGGVA